MELDENTKKLNSEIDKLREMVAGKTTFDAEVFDLRGELYKMSTSFAPESRNQDIEYMKELIKPKEGEIAVDMAAGDGFLTKPLAEWTKEKVYAIDPSSIQLKNCAERCEGLPVKTIVGSLSEPSTLEEIGKDVGNIDIVTSFGGIHHIVDKGGRDRQKEMFDNVCKILKPGGRFVAGDVSSDTILSEWFEKIVKKYSLTSHEEKWLNKERLQTELIEDNDFEFVKAEMKDIKWVFDDKISMARFMKALKAFDLSEEQIIEYLGEVLGYEEVDGKFYLNWPMLLFHLEKK